LAILVLVILTLFGGQNLFQTLSVSFGLFKMLLGTRGKFFVTRRLRHFRQRLYELLLCAEKIVPLMDIKDLLVFQVPSD
jgi:hypothetical protein